jgi:capsular polysaccharide export protein
MNAVAKIKDLYRIFRYLTVYSRPQNSSLRQSVTYAMNFSRWKRPMLEKMFPERLFIYLPAAPSESLARRIFRLVPPKSVFIWGMRSGKYVSDLAQQSKIEVMYFEDGFVRSAGLGSNHILPLSLCLDPKSVHYNCNRPSTLDDILGKFDFEADPLLLERARDCLHLIRSNNITKYNLRFAAGRGLPIAAGEKYILCCGQVEDDESIEFGCNKRVDNNDLIRMAALENPGKKIVYKSHPDYVANNRQPISKFSDVAHLCVTANSDASLHALFEHAERVYTITSLSGFEALMNGLPVTTLGMPFYAGWGLTDDRQAAPTWRNRKLAFEHLFAGAYLMYPIYFAPTTAELTDLRCTIDYLLRQISNNAVLKGTLHDLTRAPST